MAKEKLMIAAPVVPVEIGAVDAWPSHMTLVSWFDLEAERWKQFDEQFQSEEIVWDLDSRLHVVKKDTFGTEERPVQVARVFGIISVLAHARAAGLVREFGGAFDEQYMGLDWHAHISDTSEKVFAKGEDVSLDSIAVFQKESGQKSIKQIYSRSKLAT